MNHRRVIKRMSLLFIAHALFLSPFNIRAQEDSSVTDVIEVDTTIVEEEVVVEEVESEPEIVVTETIEAVPGVLNVSAQRGMDLFQGGEPLLNGGPACITCHNVTNIDVVPGGLFGPDLTDVYLRYGEGLSSWLGSPASPAMTSSYSNNPLDSMERVDLAAFLKYANETKDTQEANSGNSLFYFGGGFGLICILLLIQFLWGNRKRKMVKREIFDRQRKAWDAKF